MILVNLKFFPNEVMEKNQKSCVICFQSSNNNSDGDNFIQLSTSDDTSRTYLDKIQYLTNFEIVSNYLLN